MKAQGHQTVTRARQGAAGRGISTVAQYYLATSMSSGVTKETAGWTTSVQAVTTTKKYLWNYEVVTYTDETTSETAPHIIGVYGNNGMDGIGIASIDEYYLASPLSTGVAEHTPGWTTDIPTITSENKYLWNSEVIWYDDGSYATIGPMIIGVYGDTGPQGPQGPQGDVGDTGNGISSITRYYLATSKSSGVTILTAGWTTTIQTISSVKKYLWSYEKVNFTVGSSTSTPIIIGTYGEQGSGIYEIYDYYLASPLDTGISLDSTGWSDVMPTMTSENKYLWNYKEIQYENGNVKYVEPIIIGVYGDTGDNGLTYRYSKWVSGTEYRNDNNPRERDSDGIGYLDVVLLEDMDVWDPSTGSDPPAAWICSETHTAGSDKPLPNQGESNQYWTPMNSMQPIVTAFVLANKIRANMINVDELTVKHIEVRDNDGRLWADMGGDENFPIFVGGENAASAITTLKKDGTLTTTKLVANGGEIGGFIIDTDHIGLSESSSATGMSLYTNFIYFRDTNSYGSFLSYVGDNVFPPESGIVGGLTRFEGDGSSNAYNISLNRTYIGVYSKIKGFRYPYAWYCPEGIFAGFRPNINRLASTVTSLGDMDSVAICSFTSSKTLSLPSTPKHGQHYMLVHVNTTSLTVSSSDSHPIYRVSTSNSGWATSHSSTSQETIILWYDAYDTITYNSATRTGVWYLTYLKV